MHIALAETEAEIDACFEVMVELRPHLLRHEFVARVTRQAGSGYRLVRARAPSEEADEVVAVAGFRLGENLAWGRFLYVDDLVTRERWRSRGYGEGLLRWLRGFARSVGCNELHLDSGRQRTSAHRFYERVGLRFTSLHFAENL